MDLDARPYRAFVTIADTRSISRAAGLLNISQPALSAQLKELERRLGFTLFNRSSRRVELSPEGNLFLANARRIIMETDWINQAARDIGSNQLRIGTAHHTAAIPERNRLLERFMVEQPDVPLRISGRTPAQLYADLGRRDAEVAIMIEPVVADDSGAMGDLSTVEGGIFQELERRVVATRPVQLLVPGESHLAGRRVIALSDLRGERVVILNRAHGVLLSDRVAHRFGEAGAQLVRAPEGDAMAIARYASLFRIATVSLGWFPSVTGSDMLVREVEGLDIATSLVALRSRQRPRSAAAGFWAMIGVPIAR